jgi:hypothetical protein
LQEERGMEPLFPLGEGAPPSGGADEGILQEKHSLTPPPAGGPLPKGEGDSKIHIRLPLPGEGNKNPQTLVTKNPILYTEGYDYFLKFLVWK